MVFENIKQQTRLKWERSENSYKQDCCGSQNRVGKVLGQERSSGVFRLLQVGAWSAGNEKE